MLWLQIRSWLAQEEGQDLAEYALLFALIALVAVGFVTLLGGNLEEIFKSLARAIHP